MKMQGQGGIGGSGGGIDSGLLTVGTCGGLYGEPVRYVELEQGPGGTERAVHTL